VLRRPPIAALVAAETISATGSQMTALALPWFVLTTTGSASRMALVVAAEVLPWALLGIPAGAAAARLGPRRTLVACSLLWVPLIGLIPILHYVGALSFGILLALAALTGVLWPAYLASQQSILPALVGEDERAVAQASALVFTSTRLTYMTGPALAGALIALWGAPTVLLIDAVTFLVAAVLLWTFIPAAERPPSAPADSGLLAGVRFLVRDPFLRPLTVAQIASQAAFQALVVAVPVLAFVRYDESAGIAGLLLAAWGGGALLGSALSYRTTTRWDLLRTGELAWVAQALPLWLLVASVPAAVAIAALALSGLGNGFRVPPTRGLTILRTPPALRQHAAAATSSLTMLGGAVALAAAGPVLEELGPAPVFAAVAVLSSGAAWAGIVASRRERRLTRLSQREIVLRRGRFDVPGSWGGGS
jgi:predicted MFS family arabinose efflux permease